MLKFYVEAVGVCIQSGSSTGHVLKLPASIVALPFHTVQLIVEQLEDLSSATFSGSVVCSRVP